MTTVQNTADMAKAEVKVKSSGVKSTIALVLKNAGYVASRNTNLPLAQVVDGLPTMSPTETVYYVKSAYGAEFSEKDLAVLCNTLGIRCAEASTKQAHIRSKVALIGPEAILKVAKRILKIVHTAKANRLVVLGSVMDAELGQTLILLTAGSSLYAIDYSSKMGLYLLDYELWVNEGIVKRLARLAVLAKLAALAQGKSAATIAVYDANDGIAAPKMIETEFEPDGGDANPAVESDVVDSAGNTLQL